MIVPLDESYSFDFGTTENKNADKMPVNADKYSNKRFIRAGNLNSKLFAKA